MWSSKTTSSKTRVPLMLSHNPAKFSDHRRSGSEDMMSLVVEGLLLQSTITVNLESTWDVKLISPVLVTCFLAYEWWNIDKKQFAGPLSKYQRVGEEKKHCVIIRSYFKFSE